MSDSEMNRTAQQFLISSQKKPIHTDMENKIIAIRSLASNYHATHIEPNIISILWNIGKRCNYDCSYCFPWLHDNISDHAPLSVLVNTFHQIAAHASQKNKKISVAISGGEPLVHPDIVEFFCHMRQNPVTETLLLTTNGSVSLSLMRRVLEFIDCMTVSLHFERPWAEVEKIIKNVHIICNEFTDKFITVTVVCSAGKLDQWIKARDLLNNLGIKHTFRSIKPNLDDNQELIPPEVRQNKIGHQVSDRTETKKIIWNTSHQRTMEYYNEDERKFLKSSVSEVFFQNMAFWTDNNHYYETHSDVLYARQLTQFEGWTCYVGVDGFIINNLGDVYRAACYIDGTLGNIYTKFTIPTEPVRCTFKNCLGQPDIVTRKCAPGHESFIQSDQASLETKHAGYFLRQTD